jgi:hypothetical protein
MCFQGEKPLPYQRGGGFKYGHCIIFSKKLFGNVSWTTNMKPYGRWKLIKYILYVH